MIHTILLGSRVESLEIAYPNTGWHDWLLGFKNVTSP